MFVNMRILILVIIISLTSSCFDKKAKQNDLSCNSSSCLEKVCPGYSTTDTYTADTNFEICEFEGSCEIPNMPLLLQLGFNVPGSNIACGPTAVKMITDSLISTTQGTMTGWLNLYSSITSSSDPTGSSTGYCSNNKDCRQMLSVANELINASWTNNPKKVTALETAMFFEERATELNNVNGTSAKDYQSNVFPNDIDQCTFASGNQALNNSHPWAYSILYLEYPIEEKTSSTYNGAELLDISINNISGPNGHYIAMKGFEAQESDIIFKFHDPIYGIKYYKILKATEDEPLCVVKSLDGACVRYIKIKQLPSGFNGSVAFLVANPGEESSNNYYFKLIAAVSGITP